MKDNLKDNPNIVIKEEKGLLHIYQDIITGEEYCVLGELSVNNNDIDYSRKVRIEVTWNKNIPLIKQLVKLIKLCPELKKTSRTEILEEIKIHNTWKISGFELWRAIEIRELCDKVGLNVSILD